VSARPPLPAGTVTFLFTDIEGSTRLLQEHGPAYADLLAEHQRVIREAVARHDGAEVESRLLAKQALESLGRTQGPPAFEGTIWLRGHS
jgi:class 3 adenylate cyclase